MNYDWDFSILEPYIGALLRGTLLTLWIAVVSCLLGTIFGFLQGYILAKLPAQRLFLVLNDACRSVPMIVLLFAAFYFPYQQMFGIKPLSAVNCAILALSFSQAVFTADLVRSANMAVSKDLILAGEAIGLSQMQIAIHLRLPSVFREILPALIGYWIGTLKLSSLASIIGAQDVVYVAKVAVSQQFRSLEAWIAVGTIYIVIITPLTALLRRFENSPWITNR